MKDTKTINKVAAFLRRYPDGYFASRARQLKLALAPHVAAIILPTIAAPKPIKPAVGVYPKSYRPGDTFKDCDDCPEMVVIPPGQFRMGDLSGGGDKDEKPAHDVRIDYSFSVGKFEVTQAQWHSVMEYNPSYFEGSRRPVERVSWEDAKSFVNRLRNKTGKDYRLLSEAEWEYVVRAGTTTQYHWGDNFDGGKVAKGSVTEPVGRYAPNAFGLYDMHGNVCEWCQDWYAGYDGKQKQAVDPTGPKKGRVRVWRGGNFADAGGNARSASRLSYGRVGYRPDFAAGFRVVRTFNTAD